MKQWYEQLYEDFDTYAEEPYTKGTTGEVDFVISVIGDKRGSRILDVGCGNGRHSLELSRRGYQVIGVDLSASMLEQGRAAAARESLDVEFVEQDARKLNFRHPFDTAIMLCEGAFSLMEEDAMDSLILENIYRALKFGGSLIMTAPNAVFMFSNPSNEGFDHVTFRETFKLEKNIPGGRTRTLSCNQRYYTCPELNKMLLAAGFSSVEFFACSRGGYMRKKAPTAKHFELGAIAVK